MVGVDSSSDVRRVVLVPIGGRDALASSAVRHARLVPATERRAVHVASDDLGAQQLGLAWMEAPLCGLPLDILDEDGGVPRTIARHVGRLVEHGAEEVVVVIAEMSVGRLPRLLLHDRTGEAISRAVEQVPGAVTALVPVSMSS